MPLLVPFSRSPLLVLVDCRQLSQVERMRAARVDVASMDVASMAVASMDVASMLSPVQMAVVQVHALFVNGSRSDRPRSKSSSAALGQGRREPTAVGRTWPSHRAR